MDQKINNIIEQIDTAADVATTNEPDLIILHSYAIKNFFDQMDEYHPFVGNKEEGRDQFFYAASAALVKKYPNSDVRWDHDWTCNAYYSCDCDDCQESEGCHCCDCCNGQGEWVNDNAGDWWDHAQSAQILELIAEAGLERPVLAHILHTLYGWSADDAVAWISDRDESENATRRGVK